ncbi:MAG: glycosyltransferase family 4 protein [Pirellulaceae bacterium]
MDNARPSRILHITTHLGGGVGKAIAGIVTSAREHPAGVDHTVLTLEPLHKAHYGTLCRNAGAEVVVAANRQAILHEISRADLVILHWWHHPVMAKFLKEFPDCQLRLILWCHVSGCTYPRLRFDFLSLFHKALFTTYYSFENPYWTEQEKSVVADKAVVVYGLGDLSGHDTPRNVPPSDSFTVGYVGTLNFSKLHPEFVEFCAETVNRIPHARFVLVGDTDNQRAIAHEASKRGIAQHLEFAGYSENVNAELLRFDVFGYPLNPYHFGATENSLLEAMAAGLPVIALNQCAEKYILTHNESGYLADHKQHYAQIMQYLCDNPSERIRVGRNAAQRIREEFSLESNVRRFQQACDEVLQMRKHDYSFQAIFGTAPHEWFLACLGSDETLFRSSLSSDMAAVASTKRQMEHEIHNCHHILRERSKSSIRHFADCFPDDHELLYWLQLTSTDHHEPH